jgi:hypothetical protein
MFYVLHPDLKKRRPHWPLYGKWYQGVDLPPGTYWHPRYAARPFYYKARNARDRQVFPGDLLELAVVVTEERIKKYHGLPLHYRKDRLKVLRRVRLTETYAYEELFQSKLYRQWRADGTLQAYDLRPLPPVLPRRSQGRKRRRRS